MSPFYITTPIYYVNDKPHLGTAYSTVLADTLNRYHQLFGQKSFFLTGLDEHGQKCQQSAELKGLSPQKHCDQMAQIFEQTWSSLNIRYDHFYRTTSLSHKKGVQQALQQLFDSGYIYESTYEGWYCVSDEIFYKEKDLVHGMSPEGRKVTKIKEKNYFFKMSQFKDKLIQHLKQNPHFIYPKERQNEVLGFLNQGLDDLCISRPKSRLQWGVELPFDSHYVSYVWVDALLNYVFGIGLWTDSVENTNQNKNFDFLWKEAVHLIGKDILITHAVYWPCLLMALGLSLPKQILSHGWLLNKEQEKMSKSKGTAINPVNLTQKIGVPALRYFFVKGVRFGQDASISHSLILKEYNDDLANNLGNLVQRVSSLIENYFSGKIPKPPVDVHPLQTKAQETCEHVKTLILKFSLNSALSQIIDLLNGTNQFLEKEEPWKKVKTNPRSAGSDLYIALEMIRVSSCLLGPIIPESSLEILKRMGISTPSFEQAKQINYLKAGQNLKKGPAIFPRLQD